MIIWGKSSMWNLISSKMNDMAPDANMCHHLIGVDDTDVEGSPGTGRVVRALASHLEALGLGRSLGVTRHQLLVHPAIPYTSHNSALCLGLETVADIGSVEQVCTDYLSEHAVEGADPALCVADAQAITPEVQPFGERAKVSVLTVEDAKVTVEKAALRLRSVAGGPEGIIGALAAVGLRSQGNDGRYVDLPGIRGVSGEITVERLLHATAVATVVAPDGRPLAGGERIVSQAWIRPSLVGGSPVLKVKRDPKVGERWVPYERRSRDSHRPR